MLAVEARAQRLVLHDVRLPHARLRPWMDGWMDLGMDRRVWYPICVVVARVRIDANNKKPHPNPPNHPQNHSNYLLQPPRNLAQVGLVRLQPGVCVCVRVCACGCVNVCCNCVQMSE